MLALCLLVHSFICCLYGFFYYGCWIFTTTIRKAYLMPGNFQARKSHRSSMMVAPVFPRVMMMVGEVAGEVAVLAGQAGSSFLDCSPSLDF